jgi:hypothetical protein
MRFYALTCMLIHVLSLFRNSPTLGNIRIAVLWIDVSRLVLYSVPGVPLLRMRSSTRADIFQILAPIHASIEGDGRKALPLLVIRG